MSGWQLCFRIPASLREHAESALEDRLALAPEPPAVASIACDDGRQWEITATFTKRPPAALLTSLQQALGALLEDAGSEVTLQPLPDRDWVSESQKLLAPVRAGRFFIHGSHDRHRRPHAGIALEIEAGQAFGSGQHATTGGCLLLLDHLLRRRPPPRRILDLGCGSGILALAAARATGRTVLASDIDPVAIRVARATARGNAVRVHAVRRDLRGPALALLVAPGMAHRRLRAAAPFDLVFANILAGPLIAMAPSLARALAPGGRLILSGLLRTQETQLCAAYRRHGLCLERRQVEGDWVSLLCRKRPCRGQSAARSSGSSGAAITTR
ncbi:MAG: 50S ribosomal protein L11 methyltransferase [Rhodothalassiaceae bacterium]